MRHDEEAGEERNMYHCDVPRYGRRVDLANLWGRADRKKRLGAYANQCTGRLAEGGIDVRA